MMDKIRENKLRKWRMQNCDEAKEIVAQAEKSKEIVA
jgi:hypothetical protein